MLGRAGWRGPCVGTSIISWAASGDRSMATPTGHPPLIEASPELTRPLEEQIYVRDVVFTTGIAEEEGHFIVASGEADLACRITHIPKDAFVPS